MLTRRQWMAGAAATVAAAPLRAGTTTARVALARCTSYGADLVPTLARMFDQVGGLAPIVANKTVVIKINMTATPDERMGHLPAELTHWTHPDVIGATVHLMGRAGARRIRIVESPWKSAEPLEEQLIGAGWEPRDLVNAAPNVEFANTNYIGRAKKYARFTVPNGGHVFPAFDLNHCYEECDAFVSIAKMKEHQTTGVTLAMKNCFGITPCTIYGDNAPVDEAGVVPLGGRGFLHSGERQPSKCSPGEKDPKTPRAGGYRVPRIVADLVAARPIHLSIIDGIETMTKGETAHVRGAMHVAPGVLIVGTNPVATDAVGTAVMGFDPMADRGKAPFEKCDSTLRLAEELGVGPRDLNRIDVAGVRIADVRFAFRDHHARSRT